MLLGENTAISQSNSYKRIEYWSKSFSIRKMLSTCFPLIQDGCFFKWQNLIHGNLPQPSFQQEESQNVHTRERGT